MKKLCSKCRVLKRNTDFNFKDKKKKIRKAQCKKCTRLISSAAYYKNRRYYLRYRKNRNHKLMKENMCFLYKYLCKNPCVDCGVSNPVVLQFDHVKGKKRFSVCEMLRRRYSINAIIIEVNKCVVRCANCHAKKTAKERKYYAYFHNLD
jgi:hypothetical protein